MNAAEHEAAIGRLLADLGDTADKVADRMRTLGIKGERQDSCLCPVAKLLHANGYSEVEVDAAWLWPYGTAGDSCLVVPNAVSEFVLRFDEGVYLDLVEVS